MNEDKKLLLKNYLSNLVVNVTLADFTHCNTNWRELNYIPSYNKLYYICEGEGWLKIGTKDYYPRAGQLFLMPAGALQSYSAINDNTFKKYWCHFTATIGEVNLFDIIQLPFHIDVMDKKQSVEWIFNELVCSYKSQEIVSSLKVKAMLLELIAYYIEETVIEKIFISNSSAAEKINSLISYIDRHLGNNITVDELARIVHFHPNYFIKFFKSYLGISPIHYINKIRMDRAKNLLKTSETPIKEIASRVGFNDLFYFSKTFKSYTGFTPSEFRNI